MKALAALQPGMPLAQWWLAPLVFVAALLLTGAVRRHALAHQLLDIPNARSSHLRPTPRGGGIAIVFSFLAAVLVLAANGVLAPQVAVAQSGAGLLVAAVGLIDDRRGLAARWRLLAHFAAAAWALYWLGMAPVVLLLPQWAALPALVVAAAAFAWLVNLYNFMDGIDGLAGIEALSVGAGLALLAALAGDGPLAGLALLLALAAGGFLYWNWPPARIFMGDVGSGFVGCVFGLLLLQALGADLRLAAAGLLLLGVFLVDATFTLLRRLLRGERVYQAHRSHAYQIAARRWNSHRTVSLTVAAINLCWLLPLALLLAGGGIDIVPALLLAWLPLAALAIHLGAGLSDRHETPSGAA